MKMKTFVLIIMISTAFGCQQNTQEPDSTNEGLVKITIMYPNGEGMFFDMDYYKKKHMPMLSELYGDKMKKYEIDLGISGRTPEDKVLYLAIGYLYFESLSDYNAGFGPNKEKILGDIPNYTNIRPIVQISEVVK